MDIWNRFLKKYFSMTNAINYFLFRPPFYDIFGSAKHTHIYKPNKCFVMMRTKTFCVILHWRKKYIEKILQSICVAFITCLSFYWKSYLLIAFLVYFHIYITCTSIYSVYITTSTVRDQSPRWDVIAVWDIMAQIRFLT